MGKRVSEKSCCPYLDSSVKRCLDITICVILLLPAVLILLVIWPVVWAFDGRPVWFFQRRVGRNGRVFIMPKIRTLKNHALPNKPAGSYDIDAFATKTGIFLRRRRLDELPQIYSVLVGKMTLVGPRPELPEITCQYAAKDRKRLAARPGLTGLWQIKAPRSQPIHENLRYDLYYLRRASLWLDVRILVQTIPFVLKAGSETFHEKNHLYSRHLSLPE